MNEPQSFHFLNSTVSQSPYIYNCTRQQMKAPSHAEWKYENFIHLVSERSLDLPFPVRQGRLLHIGECPRRPEGTCSYQTALESEGSSCLTGTLSWVWNGTVHFYCSTQLHYMHLKLSQKILIIVRRVEWIACSSACTCTSALFHYLNHIHIQ